MASATVQYITVYQGEKLGDGKQQGEREGVQNKQYQTDTGICLGPGKDHLITRIFVCGKVEHP